MDKLIPVGLAGASRRLARTVVALVFLALLSAPWVIGEAAETNRPVQLTLSGRIKSGSDTPITLSLDFLEKLPQGRIVTETPWTRGVTTFEGPLLSKLLERVDAQGKTVRVNALNDYSVDVPISDFKRWPVVLATKINGQHIPISKRGPFYIMYPFSSDKSLLSELYFCRCVWQVKSIEIH